MYLSSNRLAAWLRNRRLTADSVVASKDQRSGLCLYPNGTESLIYRKLTLLG
jgi:hypothetical protein